MAVYMSMGSVFKERPWERSVTNSCGRRSNYNLWGAWQKSRSRSYTFTKPFPTHHITVSNPGQTHRWIKIVGYFASRQVSLKDRKDLSWEEKQIHKNDRSIDCFFFKAVIKDMNEKSVEQKSYRIPEIWENNQEPWEAPMWGHRLESSAEKEATSRMLQVLQQGQPSDRMPENVTWRPGSNDKQV